MSVVAVKIYEDKIEICSDSILVNGNTQEKDRGAKIFKNDWGIIADVGVASEGCLMYIFSKTRKPREASVDGLMEYLFDFFVWLKEKTDQTSLENDYIIVFNAKAFLVEGFYVKEVTDYAAIGAGMDFALASLTLGHTVEESVKVACHLSILCEEPINLFSVPTKRSK